MSLSITYSQTETWVIRIPCRSKVVMSYLGKVEMSY